MRGFSFTNYSHQSFPLDHRHHEPMQDSNPEFDRNLSQDRNQHFNAKFDPNLSQDHNQHFNPKFDPNLSQDRNQHFNPKFDPQPTPQPALQP